MYRFLSSIFCILILSSAHCNKESSDCHKSLVFENNSSEEVFFGTMDPRFDGSKAIRLTTVESMNEYTYRIRKCLETQLEYYNFEYYVLPFDSVLVSELIIIPEDSIWNHPSIIVKEKLDIDMLESIDFIIKYP